MPPRGPRRRRGDSAESRRSGTPPRADRHRGGITIYQFDASRTFSYYYAHLNRYAEGLREGQRVRRGELIGYLGSTGNASAAAPHLHFAIFRLSAERQWWKGDPINPYAVFKR